MPLLFSYGTLQQQDVQLATYGRPLHGERDALVGFELARVAIDDGATAARIGSTWHANARYTGQAASRVEGTVFEVTDAELAATDTYESPFTYKRLSAPLASGRAAWVYVHDTGGNQP